MNDFGSDNRLRETYWRGPLNQQQEQELRRGLKANPQAHLGWEEELALTHSLHSLRNVPVPSNFTARVIAEVMREPAYPRRSLKDTFRHALSGRWAPRLAFGALLALATLSSVLLVQQNHSAKIGESVSVISEVAAVPGTEVWRDYEAIRVLHEPAADLELLSLLQ